MISQAFMDCMDMCGGNITYRQLIQSVRYVCSWHHSFATQDIVIRGYMMRNMLPQRPLVRRLSQAPPFWLLTDFNLRL